MRIIAIDWSGAKRPAGKLWLAEVAKGDIQRVEPLRSREDATSEIIRCCKETSELVVGLDFAFSMPAWFLTGQGLSTAFDLWVLAEKEGKRWLQDCSSPFWGRPRTCRPNLAAHYRSTENEVERVNGIAPKSCFQIGGAGSVGTGSIRGMPALRRIHQAGISIWPFDPPSLPMIVEIYPRLLTGPVNKAQFEARVQYLDRCWPNVPVRFRSQAAQSEDAFDAVVSALVMDRHRTEFARLAFVSEGPYPLEGKIWGPGPERVGARITEFPVPATRLPL